MGWKFGVALEADGRIVGVAMAGRPVARGLDDGRTLEVTRLCLDQAPKNAASTLYGAIRRAGKALGYTKLVTYTLAEESGHSVMASGFVRQYVVRGRSWTTPTRPREDKHPTVDKVMWATDL